MERKNKQQNPAGSKINSIKTRERTRAYIANHGYVLIFSLWAIVIFGFVALSFTRNTGIAVKTEIAYTERVKNIYAARGACLYAIQMLSPTEKQEKETEGKDNKKKKNNQQMDMIKENKANSPWVASNKPYSIQIGNRNCDVFITDESGKININQITDDTRARFVTFLTSYALDEITAETIADSLLDWLDEDDFHHINGAEKDYYASLQDPYEPKNGPFGSIEELALVKGFSPQIYEKLKDHLTIYGSGKINVNSASREALLYVPTITPEIADEIIRFRKKEGIIKDIDILKELFRHFGIAGGNFQKAVDYLTISASNYITINSIASSGKTKNSYKIIVRKGVNRCSIIASYPE